MIIKVENIPYIDELQLHVFRSFLAFEQRQPPYWKNNNTASRAIKTHDYIGSHDRKLMLVLQ